MPAPKTFTVEIEVLGIPESAGLRIRTRKPRGLYLSFNNFAYAMVVFESYLIEFVFDQKAFPEETFIGPTEAIDWEKMLAERGGSITFRTYGDDEEPAYCTGQTVEVPNGAFFERTMILHDDQTALILIDSFNQLDKWLLESIDEDYPLAPSRHALN